MGLTYSMRKMTVMLLETGRTANPTVQTLGRFLRACGALWGEVTDLLDGREPVEIDLKPIRDSEFDVRDKQRMEWAVEKQVRKFETKLAMPVGGKPLHPGKQAETVRKLRNYRIVVSIIEQAVAELLADKPVVSIEYPRYKAVAREALGLLWRAIRGSRSSKVRSQSRQAEKDLIPPLVGIADKLAEKAEYWVTQKLDAALVREVQTTVIRRFAALQETNPELFPRA
jgi:hypothetical protein